MTLQPTSKPGPWKMLISHASEVRFLFLVKYVLLPFLSKVYHVATSISTLNCLFPFFLAIIYCCICCMSCCYVHVSKATYSCINLNEIYGSLFYLPCHHNLINAFAHFPCQIRIDSLWQIRRKLWFPGTMNE